MPPLWSFGLWMSRITYFSEDETRAVAARLRQNRIPSDVIHLDTGWFENDWRCDYKFSTTRFKDPAKMIADLKRDGFHISLWQLPYFIPKNSLFPEILAKGLAVRDGKGNLPYEDALFRREPKLLGRTFGRVRREIDDRHPTAGLKRFCKFSEIHFASADVVIGIDNQDEIHRFRQVRIVRGRLHGDYVVQSLLACTL